VNEEPANPPNRAKVAGIPDMAGASYQKTADLAGRVCRMGCPDQVLMSDGQWALDVFLPHRPHATNYVTMFDTART